MSFFTEPRRPWYVRLWRRLFPKRIRPFTQIVLPMVRYTHPTAKSLRETIIGNDQENP